MKVVARRRVAGNPAGRGGVPGACRDRVRAGTCRLCVRFGNPGPALPLTGSPGVLLFHTHGWLFRSVRRPSPHPRAPRLDRRSQPAPRCLDASAMRRAGRKCNDVAPVGRKRLPDRQTHARYLDRWNPSSGDVGRADAGRPAGRGSSARHAVDVAGTCTYGRRSLAGDVTVFSMQFDTCGGR